MGRVITAAVFLIISLCCIQASAQEGHPGWWWACKRADFVVEGELNYDSSKYYEVNPIGLEQVGKYYLLVGAISISKPLYINKNSQYLESYQQYLKHQNEKYPVLISASRGTLVSGDWWERQDKPVFQPLLYDLPKGTSIFALSQAFLFPFKELKLEDGVPVENIDEAMKLINARPNNLLSQ